MANHPHQHAIKVVGFGGTVEAAVGHALAGITDPKGHFAHMTFDTFEVTKITGAFNADGSKTLQATLEAYASHND